MTLVSTVIPVYHNAASLPELVRQLQAMARQNSDCDFEFIFVDDGSKDESYAVLCALRAQDARIGVVKLSRNFGSNPAILAGLTRARGDAIGVISADLQDPPQVIDDMLKRWRDGSKVVLAIREERDDPGLSSLLSASFYALFRRFAIKSMPPQGFDCFLIDRYVNNILINIQENNAFLAGLVLWLGFDPAIVYYKRHRREARYGRSMWTLTKKIKYFVDSFVAFSYFPLRVTSILGFAFSGLGLLYAVVIILSRIFAGIEVEGWSSMMVVLLIVSGVQMIMIGVVGEYLWRNLDETRKRPRFVIETVLDAQPQRAAPPQPQAEDTL